MIMLVLQLTIDKQEDPAAYSEFMTNATAGATSGVLDLPTSVLRGILAQHPLRFRLNTCSLVCIAWAAAAAEATTEIIVDSRRWEQRHHDSIAAWRRKYASSTALQQLVVSGFVRLMFSLPWQQLRGLRVLVLTDLKLLTEGSMRQLSRLTALTKLELWALVYSSSCSTWAVESQVRALQQAGQPATADEIVNRAAVAATSSELAHALPRMPALVSLTLEGDTASALLPALTAAGPAGGVNVLRQQLASLTLARTACITPELIAALPASVTHLELQAAGPDLMQYVQGGWDITDSFKVSQASTPRLGQLTQLQELHLKGIGVDGSEPGRLTALFASLSQLKAFSINGHSAVVPQPDTVWGEDATGSSPALAEFFAAMGCLTSLRSLQVTGGFRCEHWDPVDGVPWWEEEGEEPPEDYAPLTAGLVASTSLTRLQLEDISLPQGCGPHMFGRPGLRLPHLAELHMVGYLHLINRRSSIYVDMCLTADDVCSVVSCCEGGCLRKLTLKGFVKPEGSSAVDWGGLSALTTLTYLSVDASTKGVDKLVGLVELHLSRAEAPDEVLAAIAQQLTRLTRFSAYGMSLSERAKSSNLTADHEKQVGAGRSYSYLPADEGEGLGEEGLSVCEQLAADLRAVGILPAAEQREAAG